MSESEAILQFFRAMASTPSGSWTGSPYFGLRDLFEQAKARPELIRAAVEQANAAFRDLGIMSYSIERIIRNPAPAPGSESFEVVLTANDESKQTLSLSVRASE